MFAQESVMDVQELGQFESVYKPSKEVAFCWLRKQYVQLSTEEDHTEIANHANDSLRIWKEAKAQAVPEGFVLVSAEQMSQWGHMANCAQEYGCPECYEARGYAHSLACEINAYFNVSDAQEQKG